MLDSDDIAVSTRVVAAVAATKDVDPLSLTPPLADELDPDALDRLVEADAPLRITFAAWGCRVTIDDGTVSAVECPSLVTVPAG
ncbi:HalOD1 output domain-containing protein [Halomarina rubra]|uniref:HalOD1 output domain-containing protein n=1 Tax=Halomarina rubra TaxID=2071873 RepID=A0ABD6AVH1_9EURY|nr:HalOD1 output domain-containing protein [Halomarina rubra]